jgi:hypothetical protein
MFSDILNVFAEATPIAVIVRGLLERFLNPAVIDEWFESVRGRQYTKQILFSSILGIMLQVVCRVKKNVNVAYRDSDIGASVVAVYDKLKNTELKTLQELVRFVAHQASDVIQEIGGCAQALLPGYRIKYLDGNCIEATNHSLKDLRDTKAAPLPGKSLVVFEPELGLVTDVFPCEDGHAQERSLLGPVIERFEAGDCCIADRNFCVSSFLSALNDNGAFFIIRQHASLPFEEVSEWIQIGQTETGTVFEQWVTIPRQGQDPLLCRRIRVDLDQPTRNQEKQLFLLTQLPKDVSAIQVTQLYRTRWTIETVFQKLESYLNSEINTLAYPKAALFGFSAALIAFNIYAVAMAAVRAAHPEVNVKETVSDYYIAEEIASVTDGMEIAVPESDWTIFVEVSLFELGQIILYLAKKINLEKFRKQQRGPKKTPAPKTRFAGKPHVSTARVLAQAG